MPQNSFKRLTRLEKIGFGAGDAAVNISMMSVSLFLTYFYTDVFGLKPQDMAFLFLVVRFLDAFTDPLMGWITDRHKWRSGRYRPWLALAAVPFGLSVYLVFVNPDLDYGQKLAWAYATYIFNTLMFTVITIPYISLIGVITDSPEERLRANAYRFVIAKGAVLFVTTFLTAIATWFGDGDKTKGFGTAMAIMALASTLLLLFCHRHTTERVEPEISKGTIGEQFRHLFRNDQWLTLAIACVLVMTGFLLRGSISFHYATYFLLIDGGYLFAIFMSMWAVAGILATFTSAWLTSRYCKMKVFRYSLYLAALTSVAMFTFVGHGDVFTGIAFYFLFCLFSDINTPIFWASISEVVDYGEHKSGKRVSGLTFGSISFLQKFGMGLAGFLVGVLLAHFKYAPGQAQSEFTLTGIASMISIIPGLFFLATGLVMQRFIITNEYYNRNLKPPRLAP